MSFLLIDMMLPVSEILLLLVNCYRLGFVVPMEEVVRAFNWVIEKGWVREQEILIFKLALIDFI